MRSELSFFRRWLGKEETWLECPFPPPPPPPFPLTALPRFASQAASCNSNFCFPQKKLCSCARSPKLDFPPFFLGKQPKSVRYTIYWPKRRETNLVWVSHQCCGLGLMPFSFFFLRVHFRLGTTVGNEKRKGNNAPTVFPPLPSLGMVLFSGNSSIIFYL